jgi:hypothetical protein
MSAIRLLSVLLVLVMIGTIVMGFVSGDFTDEGSEIIGLAWGRVTLIDLYVGLALFGAWVAFRERKWGRTLFWWVALVTLGNLATAFYVAVAAFRSNDLAELLLGRARS